jgi:hypothetical protein
MAEDHPKKLIDFYRVALYSIDHFFVDLFRILRRPEGTNHFNLPILSGVIA